MAHTPANPAEHPHPAHLAHHFDTPQQQFDAGKLGIWLFLTTEILLFSGLFCAYAAYRANDPAIFKYGRLYLSLPLGATNTLVLIFSSFTMATAVWAAQTGRQKALVRLLGVTLLCGLVFLSIKFVEYKAKWEEGLLAGQGYRPVAPPEDALVPSDREATAGSDKAGAQPPKPKDTQATPPAVPATAQPLTGTMKMDQSTIAPAAIGPAGISRAWLARGRGHAADAWVGAEPYNVQLFFGIYFAMTGLHGVHVLAGMGVIVWILVRARRGEFGPDHYAPVDFTGLYWHLVDLVWIFLFPLFYLIT
jgi:cytochrome c oxidase subunit III